jgi:hypothetical protein
VLCTISTTQDRGTPRLQLFVFNLQHHDRAAKSNSSPTSPTETTLRPHVLGPHSRYTIDEQSGQDLRDHATSRSPEQHAQHEILEHSYPLSGLLADTHGDDAFGGSQQSVRTKCPLKSPKLSPFLLDMTRLTAVQHAWNIPTLDALNLNTMCKSYWALSGTCGDRHRIFCSRLCRAADQTESSLRSRDACGCGGLWSGRYLFERRSHSKLMQVLRRFVLRRRCLFGHLCT